MTTVVEVENLSHQFGAVTALDDLTYSVEEGEVFGMLGPNGAGKTTSIRILNGVLAPRRGSVRVFGMDAGTQGCEIRRRTGVLTETPSLYERLSGRENLMIFGGLYGIPENRLAGQVDRVLEQFGLADRAGDKAGGYSKGMKQRLALARAFLHEPQILFLDEPTSALDPEAARQVTEVIEQISHRKGRTVFLCTHNLDEAQRLCDRVAVLNKGRLLAIGTQEELSRTIWQGAWVEIQFDQELEPDALASIRRLPFILKIETSPCAMVVKVGNIHQVPELISALTAAGGRVLQANPRKHTLEDIYFAVQNHGGQA